MSDLTPEEQRKKEYLREYHKNIKMAEDLKRLASVYIQGARDREVFQKKGPLANSVIRELVADWV